LTHSQKLRGAGIISFIVSGKIPCTLPKYLIQCFLSLLRNLEAEDDDEDGDDMPPEQSPSNETADVAEVPTDEKDEGVEEDDELAEYGLENYDEEDAGERWSVCVHSICCCFLLSMKN